MLCYCHLDKICPHRVSNLNVPYSNSKLAAENFSCVVLRLIVKVNELSFIGNRVECLLVLDFEITTDNIVHSRSQENSTNSEFQFTLLGGAWDNQKEAFGKSAGKKYVYFLTRLYQHLFRHYKSNDPTALWKIKKKNRENKPR